MALKNALEAVDRPLRRAMITISSGALKMNAEEIGSPVLASPAERPNPPDANVRQGRPESSCPDIGIRQTESMTTKRVVVLGASPKPDRYAFKAMQMLQKHGHEAVPVNPAYDEILGRTCYSRIGEVPSPIDTITVYLGKRRSDPLIDQITDVRPKRIILNPGAENAALASAARDQGIEVIEGCTLVMLTIGTF